MPKPKIDTMTTLYQLCSCAVCDFAAPAAGAQLIAPSPTCPGQEAVFTCSADDANGRGATVFQVNENGADECVLDHDMMDPSTPTCGPSGVFTAALESVVNNVTYTSTLTVTASVSLDGVRVRCLAGTVNTASPLSVISKCSVARKNYKIIL